MFCQHICKHTYIMINNISSKIIFKFLYTTPLKLSCLISQVKTVLNQTIGFGSCWVGYSLECFQPINDSLIEIFFLSLPNLPNVPSGQTLIGAI